MPSHTAASALIKLFFLGGYPWNWPAWQNITGVYHGIFPADDSLLPKGWNRQDAVDIKSYFEQYNQIAGEEQKIKFASSTNKFVPGRTRWNKWINSNWEVWDVHRLTVEALRAHGVHPISLVVTNGDTDFWPNSNHYIPIALDTIGMSIFGPEAFGDSELLPPEIRPILTSMAQRSWARIREQVKSDRKKLVDFESAALKAFDDLSNEKPTKAKIIRTIRAVSKWKNLCEIYATKENESKADDMLSELNRLMGEVGAKVPACKPGSGKKLIKTNNDAFKDLATEEELLELVRVYQEYFVPADDEDNEAPALSEVPNDTIAMKDAGTTDLGMEVEAHLTPDALAARLYFLKWRLPHQFNPHRHKSGITAWDSPDSFIDDDAPLPPSLVPIALHWHQLSGAHSIVRNTFAKDPSIDQCTGMLICDEVGLGKTALALSTIAFLNQIVVLQQGGQALPAILDERPYLQGSTQIPALPHLIVTPGTLRAQWIHEIKTLFRPKSVDILLYDSAPKTGNPDFWSRAGPFNSSKQDPTNIIILTTHSSLQNDMQILYQSKAAKGKSPWELPANKISSTEGTIYHQRFLTVVVDEIHEMRNIGLKYYSVLRLFKQAAMKLGLTATPLLTSPKDISSMGRMLGVAHFLTDESIVEDREDAAVTRRAKKLDDDGITLRIAQLEAVRRMQKDFAGSILRRTPSSVDWQGDVLLTLPPHTNIIGIVTLTPREMAIINERAETAKASVISANESGKFLTRKFYHEYRNAVCYAKEDPASPNPVFKTLEEWYPIKSTKMDVCARICAYYLSNDDAPDVDFQDGVLVFPVFHPPKDSQSVHHTRRILVYAEFPSMTGLLRNVMKLYGVDSLAIDGSMSFEKRDKVVAQFHAENTPRVLIFSSVGSAGLNLSIASIVLFFDQPWSAQTVQQTKGRALRQGQKRSVTCIHILADKSSDLLMNEMAREKGDMYNAFVTHELGQGIVPVLRLHERGLMLRQELRDLLSGKAVYEPDETLDNATADGEDLPPKASSRRRGGTTDPTRSTRKSSRKVSKKELDTEENKSNARAKQKVSKKKKDIIMPDEENNSDVPMGRKLDEKKEVSLVEDDNHNGETGLQGLQNDVDNALSDASMPPLHSDGDTSDFSMAPLQTDGDDSDFPMDNGITDDDELRHTAPGRLGYSPTHGLSGDGHSAKRRKDEHGQATKLNNANPHENSPQSRRTPQITQDPPRIFGPETSIQPTASPHLAGAPHGAAAPISCFQGCASESHNQVPLRQQFTEQSTPDSHSPTYVSQISAPRTPQALAGSLAPLNPVQDPQHATVQTMTQASVQQPQLHQPTPLRFNPFARLPTKGQQGGGTPIGQDGTPVGERPILQNNSTSEQRPSRNPFLQQNRQVPQNNYSGGPITSAGNVSSIMQQQQAIDGQPLKDGRFSTSQTGLEPWLRGAVQGSQSPAGSSGVIAPLHRRFTPLGDGVNLSPSLDDLKVKNRNVHKRH